MSSSLRSLWGLEPDLVFLNHGSFGACPRSVLERQTEWRQQMEADPVHFFVRIFPEALDNARNKLAATLGTTADALAFVPNATTGVNAVLRSLDWIRRIRRQISTRDRSSIGCCRRPSQTVHTYRR